MTKNPQLSTFQSFMHFLLKFRQSSWIGMFYNVNKDQICCQVVFNEKIFPMFRMKMSQIDTENDKNSKIEKLQMIKIGQKHALQKFS